MNILMLATVVGVLFATGTFLILRRSPIKLILGLGLLSHGVNLLLFGTGGLSRGAPPIFLDKKNFVNEFASMADPLPQALILTAIVISFGVTAFTVVLVNRRDLLTNIIEPETGALPSGKAPDPFAPLEHYHSGVDPDPDDYEWLEYTMADEYKRLRAFRESQNESPDEPQSAKPVQEQLNASDSAKGDG